MTKEIKVPFNVLTGKKDKKEDSPIVDGSDIEERQQYEAKLDQTNEQLKKSAGDDPVRQAKLLLDKVNSLLALGRKKHIWDDARKGFDIFIANQCWEEAADICDVMYQSEHEDAIIALMHGVWLSVAFPINPELSLGLLEHVVDETPPNADGAAVAAAVAHYIVGLRASDEDFENLDFMSSALLSKVAEAHSKVSSQEEMDAWLERMKLNDPEVFIPRLGMVINAVVQEDQWWFDRDAVRAFFPQ